MCLTYPVLLPDVRDELVDYNTIVNPPKRLSGMGKNVVEADVKGKMPVVPTDAKEGWLNVLQPMSVAPGMG